MRVLLLILLVPVIGCLHRTPEQQVLAAFSRQTQLRNQPADCSKDGATLIAKGSVPQAHVSELKGDTAIVRVWYDCAWRKSPCANGQACTGGGVTRVETDYLVVRQDGAWKVERPISGGSVILG